MSQDYFINIPESGSASWKTPVDTAADLPASGNDLGDTRVAQDTQTIYVWDGTTWKAVATPGAAIALDGLIGDVLASGPGVAPATVAFVGGASAASIAQSVTDTQAATSANTPNTIVKRNGSGNFSAGTITANLTGLASNATTSVSFTGNLSGDVTGTQSATAISSPTVTGKLLTGYTVGANSSLAATDSILSAFGKVQGQINAATGAAITALIGDGTATGPGSVAFTLATVNGNIGSFGSSTSIPSFTVNAKGLITAAGSNAVIAPAGTLSGTTLNSTVVNSSLTSVGTLTSLAISTPLPISSGGTGSSTQNFMDLTTNQTAAGNKTFSGQTSVTNTSTTAFVVGGDILIVDAVNDSVGIGIAPTSTAVLDVVNDSGATKAIQATGYGSNIGFRGRYANGVVGTPTATLTGNTITFFSGRGYGATNFAAASTGAISVVAGENFTDTSMATYIPINTTPSGSVTSIERLRINSTGNILIGTTTDNGNNKLQVNGSFLAGTSTLTDAANIATNASLANRFTVTLAGNRNLSAPTNPTDGQKVVWIFTQDGTGGRTLSFDSIFDFGNMPTLILSSAAGKRDYMGAIYNSAGTKWDVVAYSSAF